MRIPGILIALIVLPVKSNPSSTLDNSDGFQQGVEGSSGKHGTKCSSGSSSPGINWSSYFGYDDIISWADSLPSKCLPGILLTPTVYGMSTEGRELKVYKFSSRVPGGCQNVRKKSIWVDGTFHGREWISTSTAAYFMNDLCTRENSFLSQVDIYVAPIVNPDGYEYSRNVDRHWRKTRKSYGSGKGCVGVDPNRNFDINFGMAGSSWDKCSNTYQGPGPFSEPESRGVRDFILKIGKETANWKAYISLHTYGQKIVYPYSIDNTTVPWNLDELAQLANGAAAAIQSVHGAKFSTGRSGTVFGISPGCGDDWAYGVANFTYSYTFELRGDDDDKTKFYPPPTYILPAAQETLAGLKYVANHVAKLPG